MDVWLIKLFFIILGVEVISAETFWDNWSAWTTCKPKNGHVACQGSRERFRRCLNQDVNGQISDTKSIFCSGDYKQQETCTVTAAVNGGWSQWAQWGACQIDMGDGVQSRVRVCDSPEPCAGGKTCQGEGSQTENCRVLPPGMNMYVLDNTYSTIEGAMQVYFPSIVYIKSIASGGSYIFEYDWTLYKDDLERENQTESNIFEFRARELGLFYLTLNVTVAGRPDLFQFDSIYIIVTYPPPNAALLGGSEKIVETGDYTTDAISLSYDIVKGVGYTQNLDFEWACVLSRFNDIYDVLRLDIDPTIFFEEEKDWSLKKTDFVTTILPSLMSVIGPSSVIAYILSVPTFITNCCTMLHPLVLENGYLDINGYVVRYAHTKNCFDDVIATSDASWTDDLYKVQNILQTFGNDDLTKDLEAELSALVDKFNNMIISSQFLMAPFDHIISDLHSTKANMETAVIRLQTVVTECFDNYAVPDVSTYCNDPIFFDTAFQLVRSCVQAIKSANNIDWNQLMSNIPYLLDEYEALVQSSQCENVTVIERGSAVITMNDEDAINKTAKFMIVKVSVNGAFSYSQQGVITLNRARKIIQIDCRQNCMAKFAATSLLSLRASCPTCSNNGLQGVIFDWKTFHINDKTKVITAVSVGRRQLSPGNSRAFVLKKDTLPYLQDHTYLIQVNATFLDGSYSLCILGLTPDLPPYGGSCTLNPFTSVGYAGTTPFNIECSDWKDEGYRMVRNHRLDWKEVFLYRFVVDPSYNQNKDILLYYGAERKQTVYMPAGRGIHSYNVRIKVHIYDIFGDHVTQEIIVAVKPALPTSTAQSINVAEVEEFTTRSDTLLIDALREKDRKMAATVVSNTGRVMQDLNVPPQPDDFHTVEWSTLSNDVGSNGVSTSDNLWALIDTEFTHDSTYDVFSNLTESYMETMKNIVNDNDDESLLTMKHMAQSVRSLMTTKAFLNTSTLALGIKATQKMIHKFVHSAGTLDNPLYEDYESTSDAVLGAIDDTLQNMVVPSSRDFPVSTDVYDNVDILKAKDEIWNAENDTELTPTEKAFYATKLYEQTLDATSDTLSMAETHVPDITESIKNLGNILSSMTYRKQLQVDVDHNGVKAGMQRIKSIDLPNATFSKSDVNLNFLSDGTGSDESDVQVTIFENCPFIWDSTTKFLTSKTVSVMSKSRTGESKTIPFRVSLPRVENITKQDIYLSIPDESETGSITYYYKLFWQQYQEDLIFLGEGETTRMSFTLYVRGGKGPNSKEYDWMKAIPASSVTSTTYRMVIPGGLFNMATTTFLAVNIQIDQGAGTRKKRAAIPLNATNVILHKVHTSSGSCVVWNEKTSSWVSNGCLVSPLSTENETICDCYDPPGTVFSSSIFVPPNTIDFSTVFDKFDIISNGAVFGTVIALISLYFILLIWAHRQDKKDQIKFSLGYLIDNKEEDEYLYLVTVFTGLSPNARTSSNVFFTLASEKKTTGIRCLKDKNIKTFDAGSIHNFVMAVPKPLQRLSYLRIWHDNSGKGDNASWFLAKIIVEDLQKNKITTFVCNKWLSLESQHSQIQQVLLASDNKELFSFGNSFRERSRESVMDKHTILSFIFRSSNDNFNRVQRLSCCVAMLFLTMIASAMFYRKSVSGGSQIQVGPLTFSLSGLYISFMSVLISAVPVIILSLLFKHSKQWQRNSSEFSTLKEDPNKVFSKPSTISGAKSCLLPFPFKVIAWVLTILSILVSGFFLILYSMEWGKDKSEEWLLTFFLSFFQSAFIADPLKIVVLAAVFSFFCQRKKYSKGSDCDVNEILENAKKNARENDDKLVYCNPPEPPSTENLAELRENEKQRLRAHQTVKELLLFMFFLSVLYLICFSNRDFRSFYLRQHIDNHLLKNPTSQQHFSAKRFYDIYNEEDFYGWMLESVLPFAFPLQDFSGNKPSVYERAFVNDLVNYRLGPVRLRQLRSNTEPCITEKVGITTCYPDYSINEEAKENYCKGWTKNGTCTWKLTDMTKGAWSFTSAIDIWGTPSTGLYDIYGGGGYMADLGINYDISNKTIQDLKDNLWIDRQTRAVIVQFTLYNAQNNLFCHLSLITEFPPTGGVVHSESISIFRTYQHLGGTGFIILLCEVVLVVCMIVCTGKFIYGVFTSKERFCSDKWQILDLIILILFWVSLAMYFVRLVFTNLTVKEFKKNKYRFVNFGHIALWDQVLNVFLSVLVYFVTIRLMRVLSYNQRITMIVSILRVGAKELLGCFLIFGIICSGYVSLAFLLFGQTLFDYSSFLRCLTTTINALIGKNSLDSIVAVSPVLAYSYYFSFVFLIIWIMMTMLIATLNHSIAVVRKRINADSSPYGLQNVALEMFKSFLSLFYNSENAPERKRVDKGDKTHNFSQKIEETIEPPPQQMSSEITPDSKDLVEKDRKQPKGKNVTIKLISEEISPKKAPERKLHLARNEKKPTGKPKVKTLIVKPFSERFASKKAPDSKKLVKKDESQDPKTNSQKVKAKSPQMFSEKAPYATKVPKTVKKQNSKKKTNMFKSISQRFSSKKNDKEKLQKKAQLCTLEDLEENVT